MAKDGRQYNTQQTHYLRKAVSFTTGTASVGNLPKGALVLATSVAVTEAFNAGTTNVLIVGTSGDDDALVDAGGVNEGATGLTRVAPATLGGLLSASGETALYAKYSQTGTAATAGKAVIVVEYVPDNDG